VRFVHPLTNFSSGELSENLFGRIDVQEYQAGMSKTANCLLNPQGGAYKRVGSKFGPVISTSGPNKVQILSFVLENGASVVLEFNTTNFFRILDSDLQLLAFSYDNPSSAFPTGLDLSQFNGTVFQTKVIVTHYSGTMRPRVIDFSDLNNIVVSRLAVQNFTAVPFLDANNDSTKSMQITNSNTQGPYTLTANFNAFDPLHVGSQIMLTNLSYISGYARIASGTFYISAYTSPTQVTVLPYYTFPFGSVMSEVLGLNSAQALTRPITEWAFSAWGEYVGWPKGVSTFEGRLLFWGTKTKPSSFFASKLNDMTVFQDKRFATAETTEYIYAVGGDGTPFTAKLNDRVYNGAIVPTDPYQFTIASKDSAGITFFEQSRFGAIGTYTSQHLLDGDGSIISQLNVGVRQFSSKSSSPLLAVSLDNTVFYVDSTGTRMFMYLYNDSNGSYIAKEVTLLYGKFTEDDPIVSLTYSREFGGIVCLTANGNAVMLSYNQETRTLGFTNLFTSTAYTKMVAYCAVTSSGYQDVGVGVIDVGGYFRYVTFKKYDFGVLPLPLFNIAGNLDYLDKFSYLDGFNSDTLSAMDQYQGDDLIVYGVTVGGQLFIHEYTEYDGNPILTLPQVYEDLAFGSRYAFEIATMPIEAGQAYATAQMGMKRVDQALIRTAHCDNIKVGTDGYNYDLVPVTDNKAVFEMMGNTELDHIVYIRHEDIGPCMINNITLRGVTNDG
jgi:hypothetical protein